MIRIYYEIERNRLLLLFPYSGFFATEINGFVHPILIDGTVVYIGDLCGANEQ